MLTLASSEPSTRSGFVVAQLGDAGVVLIGTVLCLLVIYAIIAARLRKEG